MSHRYHEYFDVYCCLPREFLVAYPQPRSSVGYQRIKKNKYRNTNALERTSSSRLSKYKPKNLLDPYKRSKDHYANETHNCRRRMINKIMSIESSDHAVELTRSDRHDDILQMADVELLENDSFNNISNSLKTPSLHEIENIEEFQPVIDIVSPTQVPSIFLNDVLSSFFPTISAPLTSTSPATMNNNSKTPYMLFDNTSNMTEVLLIGQPSSVTSAFIQSDFISEPRQSRKVHSLFESIEELCLLIRKLLQYELTEQKITSLQATIASQLAILLTYLAMPNHENGIPGLKTENTNDKMTSTDEENVSFEKSLVLTIGTQTDLDDPISKSRIMSSENIHFHTNAIHNLVEFKSHRSSSSSSENKQEGTIDILPSSQKEISHADLISTSVTLHLPGRRLNHALSDTFIYHIHHHEQYSSSYHQLISFSETTIHSLIHRSSTKEQTQHLLKRIGQKFQHYMELESSNTWLEASTEFTPDFLLTTMNSLKYDDDDDQTQQFGIDPEKQDYQTETISLIIDKNQPKIDTLTFNSTEKENYDSLELDIEQDELLITESNSLFLNDNRVIHQLNKEKYFCQLLEPLLETYQWQVPILPRKTNSIDMIYEKRTAKIDFKYSKIRSNSNNGINLIGKQVRIKSNSSLRASTPTSKSHALNFNNNCHESDNSKQSSQLSSTSCDSLCSLDSDTLDKNYAKQCIFLPEDHPESGGQTLSRSSYLSDVTDKLDSNITIAQTLLNMLNSFDDNHNSHPSTTKIDLLHMYIRQFLIEFDTRIRLAREN